MNSALCRRRSTPAPFPRVAPLIKRAERMKAIGITFKYATCENHIRDMLPLCPETQVFTEDEHLVQKKIEGIWTNFFAEKLSCMILEVKVARVIEDDYM